MEEILQSLDESIFTAETKEALVKSFNEAVESAISQRVEETLESKLNEAKAEVELELSVRVNEYLNQVVNEWVEANTLVLESEVKASKLDALIEGFEAMLIAGGIEAIRIQEAKDEMDDDEDEDELDDEVNPKEGCKKIKETKELDDDSDEDDEEIDESLKEVADRLMKENIELKKTNEALILKGVLLESSEGLTEIQKDKFMKLAEALEKSDKEKFISDLDLLKKTISEEVTTPSQNENIQPEVIVESYKSRVPHLIKK